MYSNCKTKKDVCCVLTVKVNNWLTYSFFQGLKQCLSNKKYVSKCITIMIIKNVFL